MSDVLDSAKQLGLAIQHSPEMERYRATEGQMVARELMQGFLTYEQARLVLLGEDLPAEIREQAEQIVASGRQMMEQDADALAFGAAQKRLDELVALVNSTILHFAGVQTKGKNCSGCSGCNGK